VSSSSMFQDPVLGIRSSAASESCRSEIDRRLFSIRRYGDKKLTPALRRVSQATVLKLC
jgi:hypothetical protein